MVGFLFIDEGTGILIHRACNMPAFTVSTFKASDPDTLKLVLQSINKRIFNIDEFVLYFQRMHKIITFP